MFLSFEFYLRGVPWYDNKPRFTAFLSYCSYALAMESPVILKNSADHDFSIVGSVAKLVQRVNKLAKN